MELSIVEEKKNTLSVEAKGLNHTLPNLLRATLWEDEDVKNAGYHVTHPLVGNPIIVVEMKTKDPRKALEGAVKSITKNIEKLSSEVKAQLK